MKVKIGNFERERRKDMGELKKKNRQDILYRLSEKRWMEN